MLDFTAIFSQIYFLIPLFIIIVILEKSIKKPNKRNNYSKKEIEKQNNIFEDIRRHNKEYFNPKKEKKFEEDLKSSD